MRDFSQISALYRVTATISFTLIGLWWLVLQLARDEWIDDPARRRENLLVVLGFLLPATATLFGGAANEGWVWRSAFGVAGALGAVAMTVYATAGVEGRRYGGAKQAVRYASAALYAAILAVSIAENLPDSLGINVSTRELEGMLVALLVALNVVVAWLQFSATVEDEEQTDVLSRVRGGLRR